jgi:hypothetical protein
VQIKLLRRASVTQRAGFALRLTSPTRRLSHCAIARADPSLSELEVGLRLVELNYGRAIAEKVAQYLWTAEDAHWRSTAGNGAGRRQA